MGVFQYFVQFILIIALQVMVLSNVYLGETITPYVYPIFLLILPLDINKSLLLFLGFCLGLGADILADAPGIHAAASVVMAFARPGVIRLYSQRDEIQTGRTISMDNQGSVWCLKYTVTLLFIHNLAFNVVDQLSFDHIISLLWKSLLGTLVSSGLVYVMYLFLFKKLRR